MPPIPRPRSAHLSQNDESSNDKTQSSIPSLSQSRLRRLQQKTQHNETYDNPTPLPNSSNDNHENESDAVNNSFIARIRENDTLARYKRELSAPSSQNQIEGTEFLKLLMFFLCISNRVFRT